MVRKNEPTEYTPTWKKSHASRNGFDQTHIQSVIMGQAGRPAFSISRITSKDFVLERWRQQDRAIVRNGGDMAANYEEIDQTYEEAGEDPDAVLPPLRPVRQPRTRKRPNEQPKDSEDPGEPITTAGKKRPRDAGAGDEVEEDDEQSKGQQHGAHESGTSAPKELNRHETRKFGAQRAAVTDSEAHPAVEGEKNKKKDIWPVNYTLPSELPIINDMKDDFRYRWNVKFTRISRTEDIKPLWIRLYQIYGYEARDLNLDYTDGKYQGPKDDSNPPILPEEQARDDYRNRALPDSIDARKRRNRNNGTVAKTAQANHVDSMASKTSGDAARGGMGSNRGQIMDEKDATSDVANPSDVLRARLASMPGANSVHQTLTTELVRPNCHGSRKPSLVIKIGIQALDEAEMHAAVVPQQNTGVREPGHNDTMETTSEHPVVSDTYVRAETYRAEASAHLKPQALSNQPRFAGKKRTGIKRTTRAMSKHSRPSQDVITSDTTESSNSNPRPALLGPAKTAFPRMNAQDDDVDMEETHMPSNGRSGAVDDKLQNSPLDRTLVRQPAPARKTLAARLSKNRSAGKEKGLSLGAKTGASDVSTAEGHKTSLMDDDAVLFSSSAGTLNDSDDGEHEMATGGQRRNDGDDYFPPYTEEELADQAKWDEKCRPAGDMGEASSLKWRKDFPISGVKQHNVQFPTLVFPGTDDIIPYNHLSYRERMARQYRVNKKDKEEAERKGVPYVPREWDLPTDIWDPWEGHRHLP
ncbi:hypothetical protein BKA63DRAFT_486333 [Paraphoma chrysanthemicola]|nr:hypothetical protein BKA63DRAFT_486333 [Paraphoma chrysanthemicola]